VVRLLLLSVLFVFVEKAAAVWVFARNFYVLYAHESKLGKECLGASSLAQPALRSSLEERRRHSCTSPPPVAMALIFFSLQQIAAAFSSQ